MRLHQTGLRQCPPIEYFKSNLGFISGQGFNEQEPQQRTFGMAVAAEEER
jgi:hypothetical protein